MKTLKFNLKKEQFKLSPTKQIALSFIAIIIIGSILLTLPISNKGEIKPYIDNLFVATSAVCVTGLSPVTVIDTYNILGQIIIILLVQIGGLGFITFLYLVFYLSRRKISLSNKVMFTEALNQDNLNKLPRILKTIFIYTLTIEAIAAVIWTLIFIKDMPFAKSIYYGIWHAISAFCNAGFDLLGSSSLIKYQLHPLVNIIVCIEIILGGLGFLVILDIIDKFKKETKKKCIFNLKRYLKSFSLHTKIVLITTVILLISGTLLFYLLEFNNSKTIGNMSFNNQMLVSFFQSTTTRTAGFASVNMFDLNRATKLMMCIFMFIGGSPASTAGGVKTITVVLSFLMLRSVYKGQKEVYIFNRRIKKRIVLSAFTIITLGILACLTSTLILSFTETSIPLENILMEVFSAFGTVGLSASLTPMLTNVGKIVIMVLMYMGRIGPVSLIILFTRNSKTKKRSEIRYPDEDVLVG